MKYEVGPSAVWAALMASERPMESLARAPRRKQISEVRSIDVTVTIDIRLRKSRVDWSPEREQGAEVCAVDLAVDEQVCDALADIGNGVVVEVWRAGSEFTHVTDAVVVAVCLRWVRDGGAVVDGVGATIAVSVDFCDYDGVEASSRDTCACAKVTWRVALTGAVVSPASDEAIGSECDDVSIPTRDA